MTALVLDQSHPRYAEAFALISDAYAETINVAPTDRPPTLIALTHQDMIVGACGVKMRNGEKPFQTELYCTPATGALLAAYDAIGTLAPSDIAEACSFGVPKENRSFCPELAAHVIVYLHQQGVQAMLMTQAITVKRILSKIPVAATDICKADLQYYAAPDEEIRAWNERYFRVARPHCSVLNVAEAATASLEYLRTLHTAPLVLYSGGVETAKATATGHAVAA